MVRRGLVAAVLGTLAFAAPAGALPSGSTVIVDRPSGFGALPFDGAGSASFNRHAISANGCFVLFESSGDYLLPSDDNAARNMYRVDRCTPGSPLIQVNTTSAGVPSEASSSAFLGSISSDGRFVAFQSNSHVLDPVNTTLGRAQVYVKDLQTGGLELASRNTGANGAAFADGITRALITGSGTSVVFSSTAAVDADNVDGTANQTDLYVRDLLADTTHMVSVTTGGAAGHAVSAESFDVDRTAARVVFTTSSKLDPVADTDTGFDAYVRLGIGGSGEATQLISRSAGGGQPAGADSGLRAAMSAEGVFAAYTTAAHVFVVQCALSCGTATQQDAPQSGGSNTGFPTEPAFGPDPGSPTTRVYWRTTSGLDPADTDGLADLYGRDLGNANPNTAIHLMTGGITGDVADGQATDNGALTVVGTDTSRQVLTRLAGGQIDVLTKPPGEAARTDEAGSANWFTTRSVSDDGRRVAFDSEAPVFGGTFNLSQVLVRDIVLGETTLASVATDGGPANARASSGGIDGAGNRVVFTSAATNLVAGVTDGKSHVYLRDLAAGTTRLVDRASAGTASSEGAFEPRISRDGRRVVFSSSSLDLPPAPFDMFQHVYLVDVEAGTTVLVDQTNNGIPGNKSGQNPDVDGTGRHVSFYSSATNLGGATNSGIYVRDVEDTKTTWVSMPEDGNPAHSFVFNDSSISHNGRRVAFGNASPDFGYGATSDLEVFVRDLDAGTTVLASRGTLGPQNGNASSASLSGDGTKVAFESTASNLDGAHGVQEVYLRDLVAGTTTLVSLRDGGAGPGELGSSRPSLNADGSCLVFISRSDDLVTPSYGPDYFHVFLRALSPACLPDKTAAPEPGGGAPGGAGGGGGAPSAGGPPATAQPDAKPVLTGLRVTNKRFAVARGGTAVNAKAKRGTAFVFTLSENARTTITISQALPGRRSGKRCVKPRKSLKRRCTRLVRVGTITRTKTKAGKNTIAFTGRLGTKALRTGSYRASIVARDGAGQRSTARTVAFTVVRD